MADGTRRWADQFKWIHNPNRGEGSAIVIGDSSQLMPIKVASRPIYNQATTSAVAVGTINGMILDHTQTGAMVGTGFVEVLRVNLGSEVKTGAWANAIMAQIDYGTTGAAHGMAATICSEMIPPNMSLTRGALYALDLEFGCGASSSWGSAGPAAFIKFENWGTATHFSANAFLFHLAGETGAAGALLGANSNTIKVRIGTVTEYMVLSEYEDTLSIGLTGAKKTLVTGVPEIAVWSTSALTSGTQDVVKIDFTQTAAVTSGYVKGVRCTMTSNVSTPGSFNGVKGIIDYQTAGYAHGDCAPVSSELVMNTGNHTRGSYTCYEAQIQVGAATTWNSAGPCSFFRCKINGTKAHFDTYGCLFDFQGVTEGSNLFIDSDGSPTATGGIRCNLGTGYIWLLYRDTAPA